MMNSDLLPFGEDLVKGLVIEDGESNHFLTSLKMTHEGNFYWFHHRSYGVEITQFADDSYITEIAQWDLEHYPYGNISTHEIHKLFTYLVKLGIENA